MVVGMGSWNDGCRDGSCDGRRMGAGVGAGMKMGDGCRFEARLQRTTQDARASVEQRVLQMKYPHFPTTAQ